MSDLILNLFHFLGSIRFRYLLQNTVSDHIAIFLNIILLSKLYTGLHDGAWSQNNEKYVTFDNVWQHVMSDWNVK